MAEKIISPGVFTKEIDASFLPSAIGDIGAAIVGPTVKGPAMVPTVVSSYSEFQSKFGDEFQSGSSYYTYLTSIAAQQYLRHSNKLTVVRILDGTFGGANAEVLTSDSTAVTGVNTATGSIVISGSGDNTTSALESFTLVVSESGGTQTQFVAQTTPNTDASDDTIRFFAIGSETTQSMMENFVLEFNAMTKFSKHVASASHAGQTLGTNLIVSGAAAGTGANGLHIKSGSFILDTSGGTDTAGTSTTAFKLNTHADGAVMNSSGSNITTTDHQLTSGSKDNIRWEVSSVNNAKGTFTLLIRQGNDSIGSKQILETHTDLSLDPQEPNYIGKRLGDSYASIQGKTTSDPYIQYVGNYPNKSKYVYVSDVKNTDKYLDDTGVIRVNAASASLPPVGSGSAHGGFGGGLNGVAGFDSLGNVSHTGGEATAVAYNFYDSISAVNSQGFSLDSTTEADGGVGYTAALNLLSNADEYDINLLLVPGIVDSLGGAHTGIITKAIDVCENRGDCFLIYDTVAYSEQTLGNVTTKAATRNTNYGATYWPWVQISDPANGVSRWVPPSTVLSGIYAFNDKIAAPWFAPAGLNRGGLDSVIQASRKLTHANRDSLYESNVNPIATFPGQGVCVWGQKTLQKKSSALDRVNVRRLMIKVKKFISASSRFLVFEQNNTQTRERFLNIVNPYLEQVQAQSGLNAFKVVMDETNNTPDTIDRNILYGQLFLQPTRTAEFIVLDFTIQPTGAAFPE